MGNREFTSFNELVIAMERDVTKSLANTTHIMRGAGEIVKTHAQAQLGHYMTEGGPFPGQPWAQLADSTLAQKAHDTPLVETGKLHDSIEVTAENHHAYIGVKSDVGPSGVDIGDIAVWQEFGTIKDGGHVPPRPFLGPALHDNHEKIGEYIAKEIFRRLR